MECERFVDEKLLLAHGEIGHVSEFDAHLASCHACRIDVEEMREVRRRYGASGGEPMPEPLRQRLLAMRPRVARAPLWQRWLPAAAAAVLIAVLVAPFALRPREPFDDSFHFRSFDDVRKLVPQQRPPDPAPRDLDVDRKLRELRRKLDTLNDYDW